MSGTRPPGEGALGFAVSTALGGLAALRRGKAVHPHGIVFSGELEITGHPSAPAAELLRVPAAHPVIVRFSRSIGWPRPLPDLLGMAIRVPDVYGPARHQDLMLITSIDRPLLHHLFIPVRDAWDAPYSTSLPYRAGARSFLLGALPALRGPAPQEAGDLDRLATVVREGRVSFDLAMASLEGRFDTVLGRLRLTQRLGEEFDALTFNPWNTGEDLTPSGWLNGMRAAAYRRSQVGWGFTQPGGRQRQERVQARALQFDVHQNEPGSGT